MQKPSMNWIRERRDEIGISQDDLARRLQLEGETIDRSAIGHWENDRRVPRLNNRRFRQALAKALELDEAELLLKSGYHLYSEHTESGEEGAHIIDRLDPYRQDLAIRLLKALEN